MKFKNNIHFLLINFIPIKFRLTSSFALQQRKVKENLSHALHVIRNYTLIFKLVS